MAAEPFTSYLDLEDPFTVISSPPKNSPSKSPNSSDGEIHEEWTACEELLRNMVAAIDKKSGAVVEKTERARDNLAAYEFEEMPSPSPPDNIVSAEPAPWNFYVCDPATSPIKTSSRDSLLMGTPVEIRGQSGTLVDIGPGDMIACSLKDMRMLVKVAVCLIADHDLLMVSRDQLIQEMNTMHTNERKFTMALLCRLPEVGSVCEAARHVIGTLANKLEGLGPCPSDEELLGKCLKEELGGDAVPDASIVDYPESFIEEAPVMIVDTTRPPPSVTADMKPVAPDLSRPSCHSAEPVMAFEEAPVMPPDMSHPPPCVTAANINSVGSDRSPPSANGYDFTGQPPMSFGGPIMCPPPYMAPPFYSQMDPNRMPPQMMHQMLMYRAAMQQHQTNMRPPYFVHGDSPAPTPLMGTLPAPPPPPPMRFPQNYEDESGLPVFLRRRSTIGRGRGGYRKW